MKFSINPNLEAVTVAIFYDPRRTYPDGKGGSYQHRFYVYAPRSPDEQEIPSYEFTRRYPYLAFLDDHDWLLVDCPEDAPLDDWDNYFIVCNADCAFPPRYIVNAQNEQDAMEIFCDGTHMCVVEEPDLKDYADRLDDLHLDNHGRYNDTDQLHIQPVEIALITTLIPNPTPTKNLS